MKSTAAALLLVLTCLSLHVHAQTVTTVVNNGPSTNRIDLIFVGDGYTAGQIETDYAGHVQEELDYLFNGAFRNPFPRYENFFNAHRVNVISNESGADQPPLNIFRDTALDATYWTGNIERCLYLDTGKANQAVGAALAGTGIDIDARLGLVNDTKYGGCGGQWAVYAAGNSSAADIGVHELGHSLGGLADEYFSPGFYNGPEPSSVNLTANPDSGKWDRWVGYNDPDTPIGPIGYYEGGGYHQFGLFRPSVNSEMRNLFRPFDAVSREQFIRRFYQEVDPLDAWSANGSALSGNELVWVDPVDAAVIGIEWSLNGSPLGITDDNVDLAQLGLPAGNHQLQARAYDTILDHSFTGSSLDWWRLEDTSLLEQTITWNISIATDGDF
ncbi:MAG: M64 family metallopeptidase, partial [Planctomycetota bacterium]